MKPEEIISDEEITHVHGYANFGSMTPREVVNDGVRKYAIGYTGGSTQVSILREHGLITKPVNAGYRANLTEKGKRYARAIPAINPAAIREAALREAAYVAINACLVPPDGGSPTEEERLVCEEAYRRILDMIGEKK